MVVTVLASAALVLNASRVTTRQEPSTLFWALPPLIAWMLSPHIGLRNPQSMMSSADLRSPEAMIVLFASVSHAVLKRLRPLTGLAASITLVTYFGAVRNLARVPTIACSVLLLGAFILAVLSGQAQGAANAAAAAAKNGGDEKTKRS